MKEEVNGKRKKQEKERKNKYLPSYNNNGLNKLPPSFNSIHGFTINYNEKERENSAQFKVFLRNFGSALNCGKDDEEEWRKNFMRTITHNNGRRQCLPALLIYHIVNVKVRRKKF